MSVQCDLKNENCGFSCTGYEGGHVWKKIHDAAKSIEKLSTVLRGGKGNVALAIKKLTPQAKKMIDAEIEKIKRGEYVVDPEAAERSALFNKDEEAIMPKGSFQEIKEQWVRDNIKVL